MGLYFMDGFDRFTLENDEPQQLPKCRMPHLSLSESEQQLLDELTHTSVNHGMKPFPFRTLRDRAKIMEGLIIKMYEGYLEDQKYIGNLQWIIRDDR